MPCLHERDLSKLAQKHIAAQKANIQNQRTRLGEIQRELRELKNNPDSDRIKVAEAEKAIADLEYHLNGRVNRAVLESEAKELRRKGVNPDRLKKLELSLSSNDDLLKDPDLDSAETRAIVMEALYNQRPQFVFEDTAFDKDSDGNPIPRYASVFGAPTVTKMLENGDKDIAEDLMLRSVSLVTGGESSRNPNDYLDTTGIEVKKSLSDGIEHHHIYNNVYVDEQGKVAPNSVRFFVGKTGNIEMQVIPEYYNSAKHGRNTQFIELMDGAHSGDDTATHLHYYKFDEEDSSKIQEKIKSKVGEISSQASARIPKLQTELNQLVERKEEPRKYEDKLLKQISDRTGELEKLSVSESKYTTTDKRGTRRKNKGLTPEEEQELTNIRESIKLAKKQQNKLQKSLDEHRLFVNAENDIKQWSKQVEELQVKIKVIKLNVKFPTEEFTDKESARTAKQKLDVNAKDLKAAIAFTKKMLREKGSISQQIKDKQTKVNEAKKLSNLTEKEALEIYENTNGYFHFDKGHQESQDYSKSRPKMNAEIHKYNAREATEYLEREYGEKAIEALQELARKNYKRNLLYNLETLVNKAAGSV